MFYPDKKPHISPSAFSAWHRNRPTFIRSYFKNEKTPETWAMKAGKRIHALIEGGFLAAVHRFDHHENPITIKGDMGINVYGIPDSYGIGNELQFVDYKTGQENHWTAKELASDLKMKMTAWLVWKEYGADPTRNVVGHIEWIGMEWNGVELVPTATPHVVLSKLYFGHELADFTSTIANTINEINEAYEKWLLVPTESLVEEADVLEYARLEGEVKVIEARQKEIKEKIAEQLSFAGQGNYDHPLGSFYFSERKTYDYPKTLKIGYKEMGLVLEDAEEIIAATSAAKKNWEIDHDPKSISKSLGFRAKRGK